MTGASGFVGSAVCDAVVSAGSECIAAVRKADTQTFASAARPVAVGGINAGTQWAQALAGVDVVIHCAARAHIMKDHSADPLKKFREVNVDGTLSLARQAADVGVKRFIFISSIGVNGSSGKMPFLTGDVPNPTEPYAMSKYEAEIGLRRLSDDKGFELVIVRPPLVYGPSAPGNFGSLLRWVAAGVPLPLGSIHNRRSLVGLDNLVDLITTCVDHPSAGNQVFLVSDGEDVSTTQLLQRLAIAMNRPARLIPVPAALLRFAAIMLGKRVMARRLLGSLQVDITKTRETLGWNPPVSLDEGLRRCIGSPNRGSGQS